MPPAAEEGALDLSAYYQQVEQVIDGQPRWRVDPSAVVVDFFSFSKLLMYEDLDAANWPEEGRPGDHPVLKRLLRDGFDPPASRIGDNEPLDPHLPAEETHHVVDADSSQTRAILDVSRGLNLILQGPPGTGKSQTITNIIAEALAEDKSVLFVSEKMAALEVVRRNMESVGLGPACLELHSHKTRPADVLQDLEQTLSLGRPKVGAAETEISVFEDARAKLNRYANAVNEPIGSSGVRPYDAYGELVQLEEQLSTFAPVPVLDVPEMTAWDRETFGKRRFLVAQLESHLQTMGVPAEHPFRGSAKQRYLPAEKARIEAAAEEATQALEAYEAATGRLSDLLHGTPPEDPQDATTLLRLAERVAEAPDLTGITCDAPAWLERRDAVQGLLDTGQQYHALNERFGEVLIPEAWDEDLMPLRKALAAYGTRWYRWLIGDWRRATNELKGLCQTNLPGSADKRLALVDAVLEAQRLAADLSDRDALGSALFGERWKGADSRWPDLLAAGRLLLQVHREMQDGTLPPNAIEALAQPPTAQELTAAREEVAQDCR